MKEFRKAPVRHILWGVGRVVGKKDNVISILFADRGVKEFLYPDAFDKYLVMQDEAQNQLVMAALADQRAAETAKRAEAARQTEHAAMHKAFAAALLAAEKRKTRSATRKKATPTKKKEGIS